MVTTRCIVLVHDADYSLYINNYHFKVSISKTTWSCNTVRFQALRHKKVL